MYHKLAIAFGKYHTTVLLKKSPLSLQLTNHSDQRNLKMEPIFSAVSSNTHNLYTLLQCIGFAPKATVQITADGIRVSVEEGRVVQALAFLDKALFTSYIFRPPSINNNTGDEEEEAEENTCPIFVISLSALLETLKIFGGNDSAAPGQTRPNIRQQASNPPGASNAFSAPALLLDRSCTLQYYQNGSPLSITLSETGVKTICELTTYEPNEYETDIPLQRDAVVMKIIMRSAWLHNAVVELGSSTPNILGISASAKSEPFFALSGLGGPFSESVVQFSVEDEEQQQQNGHSQNVRVRRPKQNAPTVTETFLVRAPSATGSGRIKQNYLFALIRKASRAMAVANKVSIRGDRQGVLSLQFMIEFDKDNNVIGAASAQDSTAEGTVSFVDFRFVPLLDDDDGERGEESEDHSDAYDDDL